MIPERTSEMPIAVVSVPVSDQERAKSFYVDQLGFELIRDDQSLPGLRWLEVKPPGATTSLTLVDWFESMAPGSLRGLVFTVQELSSAYERLTGQGVEFTRPPEHRPWATEAVFADPDGNQFVLQQQN